MFFTFSHLQILFPLNTTDGLSKYIIPMYQYTLLESPFVNWPLMKNIVKSTSNESLLKIYILEMSGSETLTRSRLQIQNNFSDETFHVLYPKLKL